MFQMMNMAREIILIEVRAELEVFGRFDCVLSKVSIRLRTSELLSQCCMKNRDPAFTERYLPTCERYVGHSSVLTAWNVGVDDFVASYWTLYETYKPCETWL